MVGEVFIERRYELADSSEVIVRFRRPVPSDVDFRCDYEIVWPTVFVPSMPSALMKCKH